jgi:dienelactone hydrolase
MRVQTLLVVGAMLLTADASAQPLTLRAADGVTVYAEYYPAEPAKALILLFHQAGSGKGEYAGIGPKLAASGYSALAIDQRSGGDLFGVNETVEKLGRPTGYLEAERDLEAALAWGERQGPPVILWGSSYSAALVFLVAAEHPSAVKAVLAFSPGEYLGKPNAVHQAAARVAAPIYVTSSEDGGEIAMARSILASSPARTKQQYIPAEGGVHGASTLLEARNPRGAAANWRAVLQFLNGLD